MVNRGRYKNNDKNKSKTHCPNMHDYDEKNTYIDSTGARHCRNCDRQRRNVINAKKRLQREEDFSND